MSTITVIMIKTPGVTLMFFLQENLNENGLISVFFFCYCFFSFIIYSVQFIDMYRFIKFRLFPILIFFCLFYKIGCFLH